MYRALHIATGLIVATTAAHALAGNHIRAWGILPPASAYEIDNTEARITIKTGWTGTFRFEAFDTGSGAPGVINEIVTDSNGAGRVHIVINGDPSYGHTYGAADVRYINLGNTSESSLAGLNISNDLGEDGLFYFDSVGNVQIGGDLLDGLRGDSYLTSIVINGDLLATVSSGASLGPVTVLGDGPHTGNVQADSPLYSAISIENTMNGDIIVDGGSSPASIYAPITINGDMNGDITGVHTHLRGALLITGDFNGDFNIDGGIEEPFHINGDLNGTIYSLYPLDNLILIDGSLASGATPRIEIGGVMNAGSAIAVDYDGWDSGDTWQSSAPIKVNNVTYYTNTPSTRIYEITECKGDMNNDGSVDFDDIAPFVTALDGEEAYAADFPGLQGSRVFHGDVDCSGTLDFDDIDDLIDRFGCCDSGCGGCEQRQSRSAADVAEGIIEYVPVALIPDVCGTIELLIASKEDQNERAYWKTVLDLISE